jgi:CheY-like chemotaxis protein/anti-sigma regulatory factor (Ser/Thr protein kinase)
MRKAMGQAETAREEADRANQAKTDFLSRVSHELRTPLNAILGFAQILEMDSLTAEHRDNVEQILKGGRHLLTLIDEVLEISRIEAGRLALSIEPVRVGEAVRDALDLIAPIAAQRRVRLNGAGAASCDRHIQADRQRLKQALLNLLSNAVKYNRDGGEVTLSCEETLEQRMRIRVIDTGPGIPPDKMKRLFSPFDRLGVEHTGVEGSGLGLALSKRLVEAMGGTLGVESVVGGGSTFWMELALTDGPVERVTLARIPIPTKADFRDGQKAQIVLYIEDNLSNLKLIQHILAHRPEVRLIPAMQGRLGLELAQEHQPALILLDQHLPDMTGDEVLRRLQEYPETRHIPVVMITADATPSHVDRLLAAGARGYLIKPLDVMKFLAVLTNALQEREGSRLEGNAPR